MMWSYLFFEDFILTNRNFFNFGAKYIFFYKVEARLTTTTTTTTTTTKTKISVFKNFYETFSIHHKIYSF